MTALDPPPSIGGVKNNNQQQRERQWWVVASKRASTTTQPRWRVTTNNKSVRQMMRAAMKRARATRAMVTAMRVVGNKEGRVSKGHGISNEGGMQQRGQWQQ
jgi:hypothetical protein